MTAAAPISVIIVMGVSGSGKSTIGTLLASRLGWTFVDADQLHPAANIAKMHAGQALTDEDRQPWLEAMATWIDHQRGTGSKSVLACSALKRSYRTILAGGRRDVQVVHLSGSAELIAARMAARAGHFMPVSLLQSQIATLQAPASDERVLTVSIEPPPDAIVEDVVQSLGLTGRDALGAAQPASTSA